MNLKDEILQCFFLGTILLLDLMTTCVQIIVELNSLNILAKHNFNLIIHILLKNTRYG